MRFDLWSALRSTVFPLVLLNLGSCAQVGSADDPAFLKNTFNDCTLKVLIGALNAPSDNQKTISEHLVRCSVSQSLRQILDEMHKHSSWTMMLWVFSDRSFLLFEECTRMKQLVVSVEPVASGSRLFITILPSRMSCVSKSYS